MSRGLGRIERAILACIASSKQAAIKQTKQRCKVIEAAEQSSAVYIGPQDATSSVHITARMLAYECFASRPHTWGWMPSHSQIKACTRAIQSIVRKFPQYGIVPGRGNKATVLYEIADPVSVRHAKKRMGIDSSPST